MWGLRARMKRATAQAPDGQAPAAVRASNALRWERDEPAAVKLLDGSEVEIAGGTLEANGTKVRMFLDRPVLAGAESMAGFTTVPLTSGD